MLTVSKGMSLNQLMVLGEILLEQRKGVLPSIFQGAEKERGGRPSPPGLFSTLGEDIAAKEIVHVHHFLGVPLLILRVLFAGRGRAILRIFGIGFHLVFLQFPSPHRQISKGILSQVHDWVNGSSVGDRGALWSQRYATDYPGGGQN